MIFKNLNKIKVKEIKELKKSLQKDEILRIHFAGVFVDFLYQQDFTIDKHQIKSNNLTGYTKDIILYDKLVMVDELPIGVVKE